MSALFSVYLLYLFILESYNLYTGRTYNIKKLLSSIIAILIATLGIITVSASYSPSNVIGDTNGDGNVTITDATLVQKHIAQLTDIEDNNLAYADVDGNDTISIIDATLIQKKLANIISIFPAETAPTTVPTTVPATSGENILTSQYSPNEMELEMLEIINQHRAEAGVHPLEFGYFYYDCARIRAEEGNRFFSHTRPNGTSWKTVLQEYGIDCTKRYNAENIAQFYPDAESVMTAFMGSPGHRYNILFKDFDYVAIAVYESEEYPGYYAIEQLFTSKEIHW